MLLWTREDQVLVFEFDTCALRFNQHPQVTSCHSSHNMTVIKHLNDALSRLSTLFISLLQPLLLFCRRMCPNLSLLHSNKSSTWASNNGGSLHDTWRYFTLPWRSTSFLKQAAESSFHTSSFIYSLGLLKISNLHARRERANAGLWLFVCICETINSRRWASRVPESLWWWTHPLFTPPLQQTIKVKENQLFK